MSYYQELYKKKEYLFLNDNQLKIEMEKCLGCVEVPCQKACSANASPKEFIRYVKGFKSPDFKRSSVLIMSYNPLFINICNINHIHYMYNTIY